MRYPNGVAGCYDERGLHLEEASVAKCCSGSTCNNAVKSTTAPTITDPTESTPTNDATGSLFFYWNLSFFFSFSAYLYCMPTVRRSNVGIQYMKKDIIYIFLYIHT